MKSCIKSVMKSCVKSVDDAGRAQTHKTTLTTCYVITVSHDNGFLMHNVPCLRLTNVSGKVAYVRRRRHRLQQLYDTLM